VVSLEEANQVISSKSILMDPNHQE